MKHFLMTFMGGIKGHNSIAYNEVYVDCEKLTKEVIEKARKRSSEILKEEQNIEVPSSNLINVIELDEDEDNSDNQD